MRALTNLLDESFERMKERFAPIFAISAVTAGPATFIDLEINPIGSEFALPEVVISTFATTIPGLIGTALISAILANRMVRPDVESGFRLQALKPASGFARVFATAVLFSCLVALGMGLFVVPGIAIAVALALTGPTLAAERVSVGQALARAFYLAKGNRRRILAIVAFSLVVAAPVYLTLGLILGFDGTPNNVNLAFCTVVIGCYYDTSIFLVYLEARTEKEAFDLEILARAVQLRGGRAS